MMKVRAVAPRRQIDIPQPTYVMTSRAKAWSAEIDSESSSCESNSTAKLVRCVQTAMTVVALTGVDVHPWVDQLPVTVS